MACHGHFRSLCFSSLNALCKCFQLHPQPHKEGCFACPSLQTYFGSSQQTYPSWKISKAEEGTPDWVLLSTKQAQHVYIFKPISLEVPLSPFLFLQCSQLLIPLQCSCKASHSVHVFSTHCMLKFWILITSVCLCMPTHMCFPTPGPFFCRTQHFLCIPPTVPAGTLTWSMAHQSLFEKTTWNKG